MKPDSLEGAPKWEGDLDDDCSAHWCGFLLRAEWMDDDDWWWALYGKNGEGQIDSSNNHKVVVLSGEAARKAAETAARKFANPNYDIT